jgi:hypothetical protein
MILSEKIIETIFKMKMKNNIKILKIKETATMKGFPRFVEKQYYFMPPKHHSSIPFSPFEMVDFMYQLDRQVALGSNPSLTKKNVTCSLLALFPFTMLYKP